MQTFDEKIDNATQAAFHALGLSTENHARTATTLNGVLAGLFNSLVTSDPEEE